MMTILTGRVEVELHRLSELNQMKITLSEMVFKHRHANLITLLIFLNLLAQFHIYPDCTVIRFRIFDGKYSNK